MALRTEAGQVQPRAHKGTLQAAETDGWPEGAQNQRGGPGTGSAALWDLTRLVLIQPSVWRWGGC